METLVNYMEVLVDEQLKEYLGKNPQLCDCDKCKIDIKAFALNKLKPHYIVSQKGYLFSKIEETQIQGQVDVLKSIIEGAEQVARKPRH